MSLIPNLIKQLRTPIGKKQYIHSLTTNQTTNKKIKRPASVAVILRVTPRYINDNIKFTCKCGASGNEHKENCLNGFAKEITEKKQFLPLEILYLKRADNGEVCFPGGKIEVGETEQEAAERETLEEVSIDLKSPEFALLGRLDNKSTLDNIRVQPFVYLQLCKESPNIKLSVDELVAYGWVGIDYILSSNPNLPLSEYQSQFLDPNSMHLYDGFPKTISYTAVSNISSSRKIKNNPFLRFICGQVNVHFLTLPVQSRYQFKLWGLTLDITSDLLFKTINYTPFPPVNDSRRFMLSLIYKYPKSFMYSVTSLGVILFTLLLNRLINN